MTDEGATFLDHFRVLVTEVGNALGFVRMVCWPLHATLQLLCTPPEGETQKLSW